MRYRFIIWALALLPVFIPSCIDSGFDNESDGLSYESLPPGISLRFSCMDLDTRTVKTDSTGIDAYNENKLDSIDVFFYPDGGTGSDAVYHDKIYDYTPGDLHQLIITKDFVDTYIFPTGKSKCWVYAIANYPVRIVNNGDLSGTSVPELKALQMDLDVSGDDIAPLQQHFVMSTEVDPTKGDGAFELPLLGRKRDVVASGTVPLKRVASKITVMIRVEEDVRITNTVTIKSTDPETGESVTHTLERKEVWHPDREGMKVYLVAGAVRGRVSGVPVPDSPLLDYDSKDVDYTASSAQTHSYDSYTNTGTNENPVWEATSSEGLFYPAPPFYTYPREWSFGSEEEPYLKLQIPWNREAHDSTDVLYRWDVLNKNYYYKIYCPCTRLSDGKTAALVRNNMYAVFINVAILGSESEEGSLLANGSYYVCNWQEKDEAQQGEEPGQGGNEHVDHTAEIKGARYLYVAKQEYSLYNVNTLQIPYTTSDECELVNFTMKYTDFAVKNGNTTTISEITLDESDGSWVDNDATTGYRTFYFHNRATGWSGKIYLDKNTKKIMFEHVLNNDLDDPNHAYDVSAFTFTFRIKHADVNNYYKDITVHQYPAIMIDYESNPSNNNHYGYTYVNNGSSGYGTNGTDSGSNTNFNMFLIETTVLPSNSEYKLGDPRVNTIDNINGNNWPTTKPTGTSTWSATAAAIEGGNNRKLTYYYPVNDDSSADNIIAPKVRVASSHGATSELSYANGFRRCAAYQEKGYPAGRWRLPTVAEVNYIAQLNTDGKIDRLFGSASGTTDYWCNSGYITTYSNGTAPLYVKDTSGSKYVRCVYDEWYWSGSSNPRLAQADYSTFTWGDIAR